MTRKDWWLGIVVLVCTLLAHALLPRYDWRQTGALFVRIDRWTGRVERGHFYDDRGWVSEARRATELAGAIPLSIVNSEPLPSKP